MDEFVRQFIKSSLAWLAGGVTLGLLMALFPKMIIYRPAHMHMNLLGFVTMMIFGVGYHLLPRLGGSPLRWKRLPIVHLWLGNAGLALMVTGFIVRPWSESPGRVILGIGALCSVAAALCFVVNIWRTLDVGEARLASMQRAKPLPVQE
jgi:Cytochrome C and Quinol oxidase polypeptide I